MDINLVIQGVLRQSYLETNSELSYFASKVKFYNDLKKTYREIIDEMLRQKHHEDAPCVDGEESPETTIPGTDCPLGDVCCDREKFIELLDDYLQELGDDAQLANIDLQNLLQQQQQMIQTISNVTKLMYETSLNTIRKIGGGDDDDD